MDFPTDGIIQYIILSVSGFITWHKVLKVHSVACIGISFLLIDE